jgi:hypothetical protein
MRNIVIAVLLTLILFLVFPGKKENDKAGIIPEGFIYEVNSSSRAASSNIGIYEAG